MYKYMKTSKMNETFVLSNHLKCSQKIEKFENFEFFRLCGVLCHRWQNTQKSQQKSKFSNFSIFFRHFKWFERTKVSFVFDVFIYLYISQTYYFSDGLHIHPFWPLEYYLASCGYGLLWGRHCQSNMSERVRNTWKHQTRMKLSRFQIIWSV